MTKEKFNINQWLTSEEPTLNSTPNSSLYVKHSENPCFSPLRGDTAPARLKRSEDGTRERGDIEVLVLSEAETILQRIEAQQIDITANYTDWLNIGFAFADEFGENGRQLFQRISRFYPGYSSIESNKQYHNCLNAKGNGITIKTFFHLAKQAGINITKPLPSGERLGEGQPTFPDSLYPQLPDFLKRAVQVCTSNEERDMMLLGSLVTISSCLPKIYGIYDGKRVFANLFLFITAQASAGKGRLVHCKQLVKPIHKALREQARMIKQEYEIELSEYNSKKGKEGGVEKPVKPQEKMLFIPANNSTTGVFQLLADNDGKGLIFETEGDTLAQAFKSDYGNYSDGFRKAFHHETISYYRRTDREYVDIESPCLSTVLSGTPNQISSLIPNAENGLFSRFMFYFMNVNTIWKDVFASNSSLGLDEYFDQLGIEFHELYETLMVNPEIQFCLSSNQQSNFNDFFAQIQTKYITVQGLDYLATVRRLGLIAFRMAMVLSALRILETGELSNQIICDEHDFQSALTMIKILVQHSSKVFSELPEEVKPPKRRNRKEKFLKQLPLNFNRQKYLDTAHALSIPNKTAEGYITEFVKKGLIHRETQDHYINLSIGACPDPDLTGNRKTQES